MSFDPTKPQENTLADATELRAQFNALKALIDAQQNQITGLQAQLAPLVPALSRDAGGQWTLSYAGTQDYWQVWARYAGSPAWSSFGEVRTDQFPTTDDAITPGGAWWQVKLCGQNGDGNPCTPFSNIVSFGPVP